MTVQGFIVSRWKSRYPEAIKQMAQWIQEGKIKYDETIIEGFEKMPEAFVGLLTGTNLGKMIVKAWKISNVIIQQRWFDLFCTIRMEFAYYFWFIIKLRWRTNEIQNQ